MDTMEILYYERQAARKKAYTAKMIKTNKIKEKSDKRFRRKQEAGVFNTSFKRAI